MMGRTHSVHAEPTTFGLKCAGWAFEVARGRHRLEEATAEIATGKISGPVGTYSHLAPEIEAEVLGELGLRVDPVSTQIVQRDRHAAFLAAIAILGGSLERLATEVRNLQHTEIAEVMEPFRQGQKGSSAMPHKRNPILSERIAGLARLLRGYAQTGLENQPLWHERDISHSSAERVALPDATILLDYMLVRATSLVEGLVVRPERMRENIERGLGLHASSRVLLALVERGGLSREDAYGIVQRNALRAADERVPLQRLLSTDPVVARSCRWPTSTPASTTPRCSATCPRSSPASTAWRSSVRLAEAFVRAGKVRDLYRVGDDRLLLVASDRLSAFDVVLPTGIPDKGRVLTGLSSYWFAETASIVPNHLLSTDPADVPAEITNGDPDVVRMLRGRMMIGRQAEVLPIECVVRGYISGSAWKAYLDDGAICGIRLPFGIRESDRLPAPIFTPATKAPQGEHDENIPFEGVETLVGPSWRHGSATRPSRCIATAPRCASARGSSSPTRSSSSVLLPSGELILVDEVLTPDSSRFWDADAYQPGWPQPSFDKQYVRDWLEYERWDKTPPGPELPTAVIAGTRQRYIEAFERITGASFDRYLTEDVIAP